MAKTKSSGEYKGTTVIPSFRLLTIKIQSWELPDNIAGTTVNLWYQWKKFCQNQLRITPDLKGFKGYNVPAGTVTFEDLLMQLHVASNGRVNYEMPRGIETLTYILFSMQVQNCKL